MKQIIIFVILFSSISCQNLNKDSIIGKWKFCDSYGYYEVQINQNGEIIGFNNLMGKIRINYSIFNDSIEFFYEKNEIASKFKIIVEKNKIFLENDSEQIIYYKLPDEVDFQLLFDDNDPEFNKNYTKFMNRAKKACT